MDPVRLVLAGDSGVVLKFDARIDPAVNARVIALAAAIERADLAGLRDVVPTYRSVAVYFDPLRTDFATLCERLTALAGQAAAEPARDIPPVEVPVCYGGEYGPDLAAVASRSGCAEEQVIELHASRIYRVYMLGFMPGRAYLASVDPRIAVPRHRTPRLKAPAGSVGIAREQTGFSAAEHPNGWQLIGRTFVRQFDPTRAKPFLFEPGDAVRFVPVSEEAFREMEAAAARPR